MKKITKKQWSFNAFSTVFLYSLIVSSCSDLESNNTVQSDLLRECDNGIVAVKLYTRGQLLSREVFLPRSHIQKLDYRGGSYDYPISINVYRSCLTHQKNTECLGDDDVLNFRVSKSDFVPNIVKSLYEDFYFLSQVETDPSGLTKQTFSKVAVNFALEKGDINEEAAKHREDFNGKNIIYWNDHASDGDASNVSVLVNCEQVYTRPPKPNCMATYVHRYAIAVTKALPRTEIGSWKLYRDELSKVMSMISSDGEFANHC